MPRTENEKNVEECTLFLKLKILLKKNTSLIILVLITC